MSELKFNNCKLEFDLVAQTPIIHFQSNQDGATIRASEVKPKLDKFLIQKLKDSSMPYEDFKISGEHDALNYKLKIISSDSEIFDLEISDYSNGRRRIDNNKSYTIFYGNMNQDDKKRGVLGNIKVVVICFNETLQKLISDYIEEFFIVTNFGTMQGKGFGSFAPEDCNDINRIAGVLSKHYNSECYYMDCSGMDNCTIFNIIKEFYGILKSGNNYMGFPSFIHSYMLRNGYGNEKAWMKVKKISPDITNPQRSHQYRTNNNGQQPNSNYRYVRAVLGIGDSISYIKDLSNKGDKQIVKIKATTPEIERFSSPIFFKVINRVIYIIAKPLDEIIFDKSFKFTGYKAMELETLPIEAREMNGKPLIRDLLESYVSYYNSEVSCKSKVACNRKIKKAEV